MPGIRAGLTFNLTPDDLGVHIHPLHHPAPDYGYGWALYIPTDRPRYSVCNNRLLSLRDAT